MDGATLPAARTEDELKLEFARQLIKRPRDAFKIAVELFGADTGKALYAAGSWINDPIVIGEHARLVAEGGGRAQLPTKEELARDILDQASERAPDGRPLVAFDDRVKAWDLVTKMLGYVEKPAAPTTNIQVNNNRVMVVKEHGNDSDWEQRLRKQQEKLLEDGAKSIH